MRVSSYSIEKHKYSIIADISTDSDVRVYITIVFDVTLPVAGDDCAGVPSQGWSQRIPPQPDTRVC